MIEIPKSDFYYIPIYFFRLPHPATYDSAFGKGKDTVFSLGRHATCMYSLRGTLDDSLNKAISFCKVPLS